MVSAPVAIHRAQVSEAGRLELRDRERFLASLRPFAGAEVEVVVRRPKMQRSDAQNRYFHGILLPMIAEHCGYHLLEAKEAICWHFLRVEPDTPGELPSRRSTTDLSTAEFAAFVDQVVAWAAEHLGLHIPAPNEAEVA